MYKRFVDNFKHLQYLSEFVGKYDMPLMKIQHFDISNDITSFNERVKAKGLHFFIDDYQFQRIWNNPLAFIDMLRKYEFVCSPDFSLYLDMPKSLQIFNTYKKQFLSVLFQEYGINVLPTVSWSDRESFEFCFDGIPKRSCVAISTVGSLRTEESKRIFDEGFKEMLYRINPPKILWYGPIPDNYKENERIILVESRCDKRRRIRFND